MIQKEKKYIFVLGLGVSGMSLVLYLRKKKILVSCWDDNIKIREKAKKKKINLVNINRETFKKCNLLVLSPGINHQKENPHKAIILAKKLKIKIVTDIELLKTLKFKNFLIGVTGTNGKTTTTDFIQKVISFRGYKESKTCGNIGIPFTDLKVNNKSILIVEASSFQLSKIDKLRFDIAFLLNISPDHIEWHGNTTNYINAKLRIFENQNKDCHSVICIDDDYSKRIASEFKKRFDAKLLKISTKYSKNTDFYLSQNKNSIKIFNYLNKESLEIPKDEIKFTKAEHNYQNLLSAYVAGYLLGQKKENFVKSLKNLGNLDHRMELVGNLKNIFFYNDSKSTNVSSAKTAINSVKNIFWLLGGREKKGGFSGLEKNMKNVKKAYSFGESGKKIKEFLNKNSVDCVYFKTLEECFERAFNDGLKYKIKINMLLSPACASFDQYLNYELRGQMFKTLVKKKLKIYEL
ncbi:MAG: UDP-N-acetylmuramoyl-L-alanine--D-glutamate ligase [Pseudomonadota bacterium]|nr:UDP-N-acetylmuramoyl-L-alanine--D-glutamate ligase [Pseudomonadota bacterium]